MHHRIGFKQIIAIIGIGCVAAAFVPANRAVAQDPVGYVYSKINELRGSQGLNQLSVNAALTAAAQSHANYLGSTVYVHPHVQRNGSTPQDRANAAGYSGRVGENVVGGTSATMEWAFNWWMNSPVHYRNMLGNWTEVGVAYADGGAYGKWFVVVFGNPGREAPASECCSGQASSGGGTGSGSAGSAANPPAPRPTQRPRPTSTPTITYTPSITYTPRATFTPTDTPTLLPASPTALVIDITPQADFLTPSVTSDSAIAPTLPPTAAQTLTATPAAIALVATAPPNPPTQAITAESAPSNPLRTLIPVILAANVVIIGSLVLSGAIRRRR
ncbi:MAG: hypothetical protein OHK0023_25380 [Anaerolineae bacterium]